MNRTCKKVFRGILMQHLGTEWVELLPIRRAAFYRWLCAWVSAWFIGLLHHEGGDGGPGCHDEWYQWGNESTLPGFPDILFSTKQFYPGGCRLVTEPIGIEPILSVLIFVTSILCSCLILESPCQSSSPLPPFSILKREQEGEGRMMDRGSPKLVISPKLMSQKWGHSKSALYQ